MKLNRRRLLASTGLTLLSALAFGCNNTDTATTTTGKTGGTGTTSEAGGTIKIGAYLSLTGNEGDFGKATQEGIQLAVDKINAAGGINGKKIEMKIVNDEGNTSKTATVVGDLVNSEKVVAVIGEIASGLSIRAAPICQAAKVPMITPSSTNTKVTQVGDYIFRVCFIDPFQAYVGAKFVTDTLKAKTAAMMLDSDSPYSQGLGSEFKMQFEKMGGKVVAEQSYTANDADFKGSLTPIKSANPDIIYCPGYYKAGGAIATQAREIGIKAVFMGADGWDAPSLFVTAGDKLEGSYFSNHLALDKPTPEITSFLQEFGVKNPSSKPGALTALGYDAMMLLADAIKRAKTVDGPGIRDAIAATKDFPGVSGKITMDVDRNAKKPAVILKITGKEFKWAADIQQP